jgi:hypothetical protein
MTDAILWLPSELLLVVSSGVLLLLQLLDLRAEYWTPFVRHKRRGIWFIHNDEKLVVPDARYYFGRKRMGLGAEDFEPPNSATFGPTSHLLMALGFRLFGLNNVGLRILFVPMATAADLLFALAILAAAPGTVGLFFALCSLLCVSRFLCSRHAIVEHVFHLVLAITLYAYVTNPAMVAGHLWVFGAAAAATLLFKPNFPPYLLAFVLLIGVTERVGLWEWVRLAGAAGVTLAACEGLVVLLLRRHGIARWRYFVNLSFVREFSGKAKTPIATSVKPSGWAVFRDALPMLAEWFLIPEGWDDAPAWVRALLLTLAAGWVTALVALGATGRLSPSVWAVAGFVALYLALAVPLFFYLKRAMVLFPLLLLLFAVATDRCLAALPPSASLASPWGVCALTALGVLYFAAQVRVLAFSPSFRATGVEKVSLALAADIPKGSEVFAQAQGGRFFWMAPSVRFFASDDNLRTNQLTYDWACERRGRYLLLSVLGGPGKPTGGNRNEIDRPTPNAPRPVVSFESAYSTTFADSDNQDGYVLARLRWEEDFAPLGTDPEPDRRTRYLIEQLNAFVRTWDFFRAVGFRLTLLEPAPADFRRLMRFLDQLDSKIRDDVSAIASFFAANEAGGLDLTGFGEELLFAACTSESDAARLEQLVTEGTCEVQNPARFVDRAQRLWDADPLAAAVWFERLASWYLNKHREMGITKRSHPYDPLVLQNLTLPYNAASRLQNLGHRAEARRLFAVLESLGYHQWGVYFHLGEIALAAGDAAEAAEHFRKCLDKHPRHVKARRYLARLKRSAASRRSAG